MEYNNADIAQRIVHSSYRPDYGEYDTHDLIRRFKEALDAKDGELKEYFFALINQSHHLQNSLFVR